MRRSHLVHGLMVVLTVMPPSRSTAQVGAGEPRAHTTGPVDGRLLAPGVDSMWAIRQSASGADTVGFAVQSLSRSAKAPDQWLQVYRWEGRDGSRAVDSLAMELATLRPLWQARYTDVGQVRVTYRGRAVHAEIRPAAGEPIVFDSVYPAAVFSSAAVDALARTLPLTAFASASVDLYYPYPAPFGFQRAQLRVIGTERLKRPGGQEDDCWIVYALVPGGDLHFWVSKSTRALIQTASGDGQDVYVYRP